MEVNQAKLYDRQIQIFGADTQKRISASEVLIHGLNTVTTEMAKNLALIGFSVALCDDRPLTAQDIDASPLLGKCDEHSISTPVAQVVATKLLEMNPCIRVRVVTDTLDSAFGESTQVFVSAGQNFEAQVGVSSQLTHINVPKFYVFGANYRFLVLAEMPGKPFKLAEHTQEQLQTKFAELDLQYDFNDTHTPSLDDFVLQCVFGATLNQTLLSLVSSGRAAHNLMYLDVDCESKNPNHHRRLECLTLN